MGVKLNKKDDERVSKYEVELDYVFHLKNLYKGLFQYLSDEGFKSTEKGQPENLYFEIVSPEGLVNHYIWWRYFKEYHKYYRIYLKIDWQGILSGKSEVLQNNKKRKTNKSDMTIRVECWLQWDPNKEIRNNWFLKHFEGYIKRKIYRKTYLWVRAEGESAAEGIRSYIKRYFQLASDEPSTKLFIYENKGLGDIKKN